jgi:hypothetical protein
VKPASPRRAGLAEGPWFGEAVVSMFGLRVAP